MLAEELLGEGTVGLVHRLAVDLLDEGLLVEGESLVRGVGAQPVAGLVEGLAVLPERRGELRSVRIPARVGRGEQKLLEGSSILMGHGRAFPSGCQNGVSADRRRSIAR